MTKPAATIKKAVTTIGATLSGKVGILSTLVGEHVEFTTLIKDALSSDHAEKQRELHQQLREHLLIHMQGEEHGIYLELQKHGPTRIIAERAIREHGQIKQLLTTLDEETVGSAKWRQTLVSLQQAVEAHVEAEENDVFTQAKDIVNHDTLRKLDDYYRAFRDRINRHGEVLADPTRAASGDE